MQVDNKYKYATTVDLADRKWPNNTIKNAPIWCSVDLRDGNQALIKPMDLDNKIEFFKLLVNLGFKNIEIGFPSASKVEFDFARRLIEDDLIPDDVSIQVLTQAREHLIKKTKDALLGAKNIIVHLYNSTSVSQRKIVFGKQRDEIKQIAIDGTKMLADHFGDFAGNLHLEYSPESFTQTELDFALDVSNATIAELSKITNNKVILNLPATVEVSTPNIYADQIEWMIKNLDNRSNVLVSLHPHNDRGTAVAATELGLLAGADRVEGTLLGNGERTGNVDILTLALNMFTQGIDPCLDFSDINSIIDVVEKCTQIQTHIRHPYAGKMVYTAFSGSHQDAINKGMRYQSKKDDKYWEVPYLPIDPKDVGRTYEDLIRINSQSGKGGVAFVLEQKFDYEIPKVMHPLIGEIVQKRADVKGDVLTDKEILQSFEGYFFAPNEKIEVLEFDSKTNVQSNSVTISVVVRYGGEEFSRQATASGPVSAFCSIVKDITKLDFEVTHYHEHALNFGKDAFAVAYVGLHANGKTYFGASKHQNITISSFMAIVSAVERIMKEN